MAALKIVCFGFVAVALSFALVPPMCVKVDDADHQDPLTVWNCGTAPLWGDTSPNSEGASYAEHGMFPWMVSLQEFLNGKWSHICEATLINERWIVTAGHCINYTESPERYKIYVGLHKHSETNHSAVKEYMINNIYVHENFSTRYVFNDIALLRTSELVNIAGSGGYINGVCLPQDNSDPSGMATVIAWSADYTGDWTLAQLNARIVDWKTCIRPISPYTRMICIRRWRENSACLHAVADPMIKTSNGVSTLVGIPALYNDCEQGWPLLYTKIADFRSWMEDIIQTRDPEYNFIPVTPACVKEGDSGPPKDPLTVKNCGTAPLWQDNDRIWGGQKAEYGMFPWMVSIHLEDSGRWIHICGGSIINERWILTAAHCIKLKESPERYKIYAGLLKQSETDHWTVKEYMINNTYVHQRYIKILEFNDIALLRTSEPVDIAGSGGYINGVCLPQDTCDPSGMVTVSGWGREIININQLPLSLESLTRADTLNYLRTSILDRETCTKNLSAIAPLLIVLKSIICTSRDDGAACRGDSGGPLVKTSNGVSTQVGIVSTGLNCSLQIHMTRYTKVAMFRDWMEDTIQKSDLEYGK